MSPALLLPAALGALAALLIPIVIHIARRTESRTINFAALRWLDPRPAPRRRLRIDELWLLAVRLLLLAAIAIWLSRPVLWGVEDGRRVVAVVPGIAAATIASIAGDDDRIVWLAPGFPTVAPTSPPENTISLIRQLDAELPPATPVTLIVPAMLDGLDAQRPILSRRVDWRVVPQVGGDTPPARRLPPALTIRHAPTALDSVRYFRAAATAWAEAGIGPRVQVALTDIPIDKDAEFLIWLAAGPLPDPTVKWIKAGGTALLSVDARLPVDGAATVVWRGAVGQPLALAEKVGQGRAIRLTRALEPAAMPQLVEPDFPDTLAGILAPPPTPARVAAVDHVPMTGAVPYALPPLDLRPWLALLIALILGAERWLATRRARAIAP